MKRFYKLAIFLVVLVLFVILFFIWINSNKLCGYSVNNGSHPIIECNCLGFTVDKESGVLLSEEVFYYCYGYPLTEVCYSSAKITASNAEPYLCSDYNYTITLTDRITQHPLYFHPTSKYSYDATGNSVKILVLETKEPVTCGKVKAKGFIEQVYLGDGSGTSKENYMGYHFFAEDFVCID